MDIILNAVKFRDGVPYHTTLDLTQRSDGTWHAKNFDSAMQSAYNASRSGATQSRNFDAYVPETPVRTELSDQEIAELADKYDLSNMTQAEYDAFLDELVEKGALTRSDTTWLGRGGLQRLDIDMEGFVADKNCGWAYVTSGGGGANEPVRSLEEAEGDVLLWLESMMAQQDQRTDAAARGSSHQRTQAQNALLNIIRRM